MVPSVYWCALRQDEVCFEVTGVEYINLHSVTHIIATAYDYFLLHMNPLYNCSVSILFGS